MWQKLFASSVDSHLFLLQIIKSIFPSFQCQVFCNNRASVLMANNAGPKSVLRSIERCFVFFVNDPVKKHGFDVKWESIKDNLADFLTKPPDAQQQIHLISTFFASPSSPSDFILSSFSFLSSYSFFMPCSSLIFLCLFLSLFSTISALSVVLSNTFLAFSHRCGVGGGVVECANSKPSTRGQCSVLSHAIHDQIHTSLNRSHPCSAGDDLRKPVTTFITKPTMESEIRSQVLEHDN